MSTRLLYTNLTPPIAMPLRRKTGLRIVPRLATAAAAAAAAPTATDVKLVFQEQTQWCWAACTAMIAQFLGIEDIKQCELANFLHEQTKCCQKPSWSKCNRPCATEKIMPVYAHLGVTGLGPDLPLAEATLRDELQSGRPVEVGFLWFNDGGHVVIVYGFTAKGYFNVHDPWIGTGFATYEFLRNAYHNGGRWDLSFGQFKRA